MSNTLRYCALLILAVFICGCGSDTSVKVTPQPQSNALKATLQDIAASGELGSGADGLPAQLEELKATDPAKGEALLADYEKLKTASGPEAIKAAAKAMADKL